MVETPKPRRRLTDDEVRRILHLHTVAEMPAKAIAREFDVRANTVYDVIWGRTHRRVTGGRNRSAVDGKRARLRDEIRRIYAETGDKSETARRVGMSRPLVHYYLKLDSDTQQQR